MVEWKVFRPVACSVAKKVVVLVAQMDVKLVALTVASTVEPKAASMVD